MVAIAANSKRQQRCSIRCTATLVTSSIRITPSLLNFGDCQVGQCKRQTLQIENESPLPCTIEIHLRSKIITIEGVNSSSFTNSYSNTSQLLTNNNINNNISNNGNNYNADTYNYACNVNAGAVRNR